MQLLAVAPLVGAWIEIDDIVMYNFENAVAPLVGAWIEIQRWEYLNTHGGVAPLVGAWIEIISHYVLQLFSWSLLSWERGLKYEAVICFTAYISVAPLVGAWIEIFEFWNENCGIIVAPLVGAWIEMLNNCFVHSCNKSLLSWERGLKSSDMLVDAWFDCRSSRGSVD